MRATIAPEPALQSPEDLHAFAPNAGRAAFLDQRMRRRLAASLRHIADQAKGALHFSEDQFQDFLTQLDTRPVSSLAFSYYSDVVLAIEEDDLDGASRLVEELIHLPAHSGGPQVKDLADPRQDPTSARYARFIDTDPSIRFEIFPPSASASASCRRQIQDAFALMTRAIRRSPEKSGRSCGKLFSPPELRTRRR